MDKRYTNALKWVAVAVTIAGALMTSFRLDPFNIYFLNTGAVLFAIWSYLVKDRALFLVNIMLVVSYAIGLIWKF